MYLIFDTESTGFASNGLPKDDPKQARVLQLGMLVLDSSFREVFALKTLFDDPKDRYIHPGAFEQHRISNQMCSDFGIPSNFILPIFEAYYNSAKKIVCHNNTFDLRMMHLERSEMKVRDDSCYVCTMKVMSPVCKLPKTSNRGAGKFKWPKLQEAYRHVTGEEFDGAHDALADVRATAKIFKWCVAQGHITL